jgi:hypothetical protein
MDVIVAEAPGHVPAVHVLAARRAVVRVQVAPDVGIVRVPVHVLREELYDVVLYRAQEWALIGIDREQDRRHLLFLFSYTRFNFFQIEF